MLKRSQPLSNPMFAPKPPGAHKGRAIGAIGHAIPVHFRSGSDLWETPQNLFTALDAEFHFTLDVCALPSNAKCQRYFTPTEDGLCQPWNGVCWMNPPYGRQIGQWVKKALQSAQAGATVVCLLPARPDTAWWHLFVTQASEIRFLRGRLKFGDSRSGAPFPSAVVVFSSTHRNGQRAAVHFVPAIQIPPDSAKAAPVTG